MGESSCPGPQRFDAHTSLGLGKSSAPVRLTLARPPAPPPQPTVKKHNAVFFPSFPRIGTTRTLQETVTSLIPTVPTNPCCGHGIVDLGAIAIDPSDDKTVWMSTAYVHNGVFQQVVGAVKP